MSFTVLAKQNYQQSLLQSSLKSQYAELVLQKHFLLLSMLKQLYCLKKHPRPAFLEEYDNYKGFYD